MTREKLKNRSDNSTNKNAWTDDPRRIAGFLAGLALASVSLSSGFIWVCGEECVQQGMLWTPDRQFGLVFLASLSAWWGYLFAHRAVTGRFIDQETFEQNTDGGSKDDGADDWFTKFPRLIKAKIPAEKKRLVAFVVGIVAFVSGIVVGFVYIRQGNHLLTNLGGILFFGGYVIAHYAETGTPL